MKKITLASIAIIGTFAFAISVSAETTASLSPASSTANVGGKFNVTILVDPQGAKNYVEKIEVDYPADIISATSFTFGSKWMGVTQNGYDSIDNANGVLIKTAGYPGGITSATVFGTISFTAKKSGAGTIRIGNSSLAFDTQNQSAITGNPANIIVQVSGNAPASTEIRIPTVNPTITPSAVSPTTEVASTAPVSSLSSESQTAAAVTSGNGNAWLWVLAVIAFLAILVGGAYLIFTKKKKSF